MLSKEAVPARTSVPGSRENQKGIKIRKGSKSEESGETHLGDSSKSMPVSYTAFKKSTRTTADSPQI